MQTVLILLLALSILQSSLCTEVIVNGGAEAGLSPWTRSSSAVSSTFSASSQTGIASPRTGSRFFTFSAASATSTQILTQRFELPSSCPTEFNATLFFALQTEFYCVAAPTSPTLAQVIAACPPQTSVTSFDYGVVSVDFIDGLSAITVSSFSTGSIGNPVFIDNGSWLTFSYTFNVPPTANFGVLYLQGRLVQGSRINVYYDDISLDVTCPLTPPTPQPTPTPTEPSFIEVPTEVPTSESPTDSPTVQQPTPPEGPTSFAPTTTLPTLPSEPTLEPAIPTLEPPAVIPTPTPICVTRPVILGGATFVPEVQIEGSGLFDGPNGTTVLRIVLRTLAISNRIHTIGGPTGFVLNFLNSVNCTYGDDYQIQFSFEVDPVTGLCYEVYTVELLWSSNRHCAITYTSINNTCTFEGVVSYSYTEILNGTRASGPFTTSRRGRNTRQFFIESSCSPSLSADTEIIVYAPIFITAVIYRANIPVGTETKSLFIETGIQRPFRLHLPFPSILVPLSPDNPQLTPTLSPVNLEIPDVFDNINYQQWVLDIEVGQLCSIPNTFFFLTYNTICEVPESECPIDPFPGEANITVFLNSQVFCTVQIVSENNSSLTFETFDGAFSRLKNSFLIGDTVGVRVTAPSGASLSSIEFLSAILSSDFSLPLFPPGFVENSFSRALVVGGSVTPNGVTAGFTVLPGSPTVFNFRFNLRRSLFSVPADSSAPLRIGLRFA